MFAIGEFAYQIITYVIAGEVFRDDTLPVVVNFSFNELQDNHDGVYSWRAPSGMTESYFVDFLTEVVNEIVFTEVSKKETGRFLDLLFPTPALLPMLQKLNQTRIKLLKRNDEDTTSILRESLAGFERIIVPYPSHGNIVSVELEMNNETDPTGEMRRKINQILRSEAISYGNSDEEDEKEQTAKIFIWEKCALQMKMKKLSGKFKQVQTSLAIFLPK